MVLIIILLVSGKTADFDVALEECMQLFVGQRNLLHRRHEVEKAFDEFRWVFSPNLAHKLASEYLPKPERKLRLAPPPMQSQQSAAVTPSSLSSCDEELELEAATPGRCGEEILEGGLAATPCGSRECRWRR